MVTETFGDSFLRKPRTGPPGRASTGCAACFVRRDIAEGSVAAAAVCCWRLPRRGTGVGSIAGANTGAGAADRPLPHLLKLLAAVEGCNHGCAAAQKDCQSECLCKHPHLCSKRCSACCPSPMAGASHAFCSTTTTAGAHEVGKPVCDAVLRDRNIFPDAQHMTGHLFFCGACARRQLFLVIHATAWLT